MEQEFSIHHFAKICAFNIYMNNIHNIGVFIAVKSVKKHYLL